MSNFQLDINLLHRVWKSVVKGATEDEGKKVITRSETTCFANFVVTETRLSVVCSLFGNVLGHTHTKLPKMDVKTLHGRNKVEKKKLSFALAVSLGDKDHKVSVAGRKQHCMQWGGVYFHINEFRE